MNSLHYLSTTFQRLNPKPNKDSNEEDNKNNESNDEINYEIITNDNDNDSNLEVNNYKDEKKVDNEYIFFHSLKILLIRLITIILFIPKLLIYYPIYYFIFSFLYPFRKLYQLLFKLILSFKAINKIDNNEKLSSKLIDGSEITNEISLTSSPILQQKQKQSNTSPSSKYAPKSSICTILEESIEFDPDYHENDDYFKSPSDSNPLKDDSNDDDISNNNKNTESDQNKINQSNNTQKISKLNYKLLQVASQNNNDNMITNDKQSITSSSIQNSKSATGSQKRRKKKKFIFPKLLFDFNIINPPKLPRKTLVLDLDETLIHSLSRYNSSTLNKTKGKSIEVKVSNNVPTLYHIYKRPYVEEFLSFVYQWFDLICFTASIKEYADPVIDYIEQQTLSNDEMKKTLKFLKIDNQPNKIFKKRYYRNSCNFVEGKGYLKDLSVVLNDQLQLSPRSNSKSRSRSSSISSNISNSNINSNSILDYSKIIIIDNSPISYSHNKDNGLMVEGWINDPDDSELLNLLPLLHSLRFVSDVRCILGLKEGQRSFN